MLRLVETENFSLLRTARAELGEGLTVISGESGAGKTLLMDAVSFALGSRPHRSLIATGASRCAVKLVVDLDQSAATAAGSPWLVGSNEVFRWFNEKGRGAIAVNGVRLNIADLAEFATSYFDLTGQFEGQTLLDSKSHLNLLDRFGGENTAIASRDYATSYQQLLETRQRLEVQQKSVETRLQEIDFLQFQVKELEQAAVRPGEKKEVEVELLALENSTQIIQLVHEATALLAGTDDIDGAYDLGAQANDRIQLLPELLGEDSPSGELAGTLAQRVMVSLEEITGIASELSDMVSTINNDPAQLELLQGRLDLIHQFERKYGCSADELEACLRDKQDRLRLLEDDSESVEALLAEVARLEAESLALGQQLSDIRRAEATKLAKTARQYLDRLGFNSVEFTIDIDRGSVLTQTGIDRVEFLVSLNPGEPARPLQQVASGGESSRLLLAIKAALSRQSGQRVMLLDEIEAGLGGQAARHLGDVLKDLASKVQVVAITHLPVVAALGDQHLVAIKQVSKDVSAVTYRLVSAEERTRELARMLGKESGTEELALVTRLLKS